MAAIALLCSGCLSSWGVAHSSLTPRTAAVDGDPSTVRSQDSQLVGDWNQATGLASGHSAPPQQRPASSQFDLDQRGAGGTPALNKLGSPPPRARLLNPSFAGRSTTTNQPLANHSTAGQTKAAVITRPTHAGVGNVPVGPQFENPPTSGHSFKSFVRQIRNIPAPASRTLFSADSSQAIEESANNGYFNNTGMVTPAPTGREADESPTANISPATAALAGRQPPVQTVTESAPAPDPEPDSEPSVLERLKGLYEAPAESRSRNIFRRPFERLPSPWGVFRDREDTQTAPPVTADSSLQNSTANTDPDVATPDEAAELLNQLISEIKRELQNWPRLPGGVPENLQSFQKRQQDLRLLYLVADEPGAAISSLTSLPAGEQDFWQEMMLGIAQYRSTDENQNREQRLTNTVGQLRSAIHHLSPFTRLEVRRLEICSRIMSFGRVEPFPSNDFDAGTPILLYAELDNFGSELTPANTYRTSLDARLQIRRSGSSDPIETIDLPNISDEATSERRDYFQTFELNLPSHLATGRYEITLQLADRITGKKTQAAVDFQVR